MAAVQTTYPFRHARWVKGMVLNSEPHVIVTRSAEDVEGINFGEVCVQGTLDDQVVDSEITVPYVGFAVLDITQPTGKYEQYANVNVIKKGVIVVQASLAVKAGDPVAFVPATGVLTNVLTSNTQVPNATWETSTTGAGLAAIRLS